ncbi:MAG: FHA domain-containing protein, partial [Verrucomicrobiota bacterium]|nr:FHA domain-containing protein [Verrucomicrobiota bacterium]
GRSARYSGMLQFEITQSGQAREVNVESDDVIIGRHNERTAVGLDLTPDDLVSRTHARVWRAAGEVRIEDLDSRAGTFLNGEKLEAPQVLRPGEVITLGETQLTLKATLPDRRKRNAPSGTRNPKRKRPIKPRPQPTAKENPDSLPDNTLVGLHVELSFDGKTRLEVFDRDEIFIGRKHPEVDISLDLSGDLLVSRTHARIWQTRSICWVEDLGSTHGTLVNGGAIDGACVVNTTDKVQIGSTLIRVWHVALTDMTQGDAVAVAVEDKEEPLTEPQSVRGGSGFPELDSYPVYKEEDYRYYLPGERSAPEVEAVMKSRKSPMGRIRTTHVCSLDEPFAKGEGVSALTEILPGLPTQLDAHADADAMSNWLVKQLPDWLPSIKRAALFAIHHDTGRVRVRAHVPSLNAAMSDMLAHRVLEGRAGYAWVQVSKKESVRRLSTHSGLYVPLICAGLELGVLSVEDTDAEAEFSAGDLAALMVIGQLASLAWGSRSVSGA